MQYFTRFYPLNYQLQPTDKQATQGPFCYFIFLIAEMFTQSRMQWVHRLIQTKRLNFFAKLEREHKIMFKKTPRITISCAAGSLFTALLAWISEDVVFTTQGEGTLNRPGLFFIYLFVFSAGLAHARMILAARGVSKEEIKVRELHFFSLSLI